MYNAPSRVAPPRLSTPLSSSKRNDLLCTTLRTPLLTAPPCIASTRSSVCRSAARLNSTICLLQRRRSAAPRVASPRTSTPFNDLFVNLLSRLNSRPLVSQRRGTPHRTSTQRFVYYFATSRYFSQPNAAWRFSTQRFVCQFIIAPRHGSRQRTAAQLALPRRAATQRNDLFITSQRQHCSPLRHARLRAFAQDHAP